MWTIVFGIAMCGYGAWLTTTTSNLGVGIEGDSPWFVLKHPTKRLVGIVVIAVGLLLLLSALRGEPLL